VKNAGLKTFVTGSTDPKDNTPGCANYDHYYGGCLFAEACKVQKGERCGYFERSVLPTGNSAIRQEYEKLTGYYIEGRVTNLCGDCGKSIEPRRRYCDKCTQKRRRATYRQYKQKLNGSSATVKFNYPQNSATKQAFGGLL
jgi:hypothetical protein